MCNARIDMIVTSGAVSAGKFDFVPGVIKDFKLSNFFKGVAIRPGNQFYLLKLKESKKLFLDYLAIPFLPLLALGFLSNLT
jgi:Molybdopterin biosynthesis enzyme